MEKKISVVMPVYNGERYLAEALDSVLAQTEQDWELVIVNNCSTDGTVTIAEQYAARDGRIRIHHNGEFVSAYDNWNKALRQGTGRYMLALACDDLISPGFLETMGGALDEHPECGIAHSVLQMIDENGAETDNWWERSSVFVLSFPELVKRRHIRRAPLDGMMHLAGETIYTTPTQLLFRRSYSNRCVVQQSK